MTGERETIIVHVNDHPRTVARGTAVGALMEDILPGAARGVAVAVNATVVPRGQWDGYVLVGGERILVIRASQGG